MLKIWVLVLGELHQGIWGWGGKACKEGVWELVLKDHTHVKAESHIACRAHAVPLSCRASKGLECVFPI